MHDFFELPTTTTRGHPYKLLKRQCVCTVRSSFFTERIVNIWNCLPSNTADYSSLTAFKRTVKCVDLVISSTLHRFLRAGIVSLTFVLMFLFYIIFYFYFLGRLLVLYFSLVAICHLFFLHVVLCSWQIIDDDDDLINRLIHL